MTTWSVRAVGEATVLLDADEQYDVDPQGDPPIRTATYRAALRAALMITPHGPRPARGRTQEEIDAYRAGQIDILGEVARSIANALYG